MCEDVGSCAKSYFMSLNSMARRVMVDSRNVRHRREVEGTAEDAAAAFVPQEIREKYAFYPQNEPDVDCFPKLCIRSGGKYVVDEGSHGKGSGCTWKDEHSSPFIWETQSQLDLSYVGTDNVTKNSKTDSTAVVFVAEKNLPSSVKQTCDVRKENASNGSVVNSNNNKDSSPRMFLTKKMEKQLSGKCFDKAPALAAASLLPPLPDRPPPCVATTNKPTNGSSMKCPPPKPPSKKTSSSRCEPPPPPVAGSKKSEFKQHPVISGSDSSSTAIVVLTPTAIAADANVTASALKSVATESAKAVETAAVIDLSNELESFEVDLSPSDDIPKTGFDFLDNW